MYNFLWLLRDNTIAKKLVADAPLSHVSVRPETLQYYLSDYIPAIVDVARAPGEPQFHASPLTDAVLPDTPRAPRSPGGADVRRSCDDKNNVSTDSEFSCSRVSLRCTDLVFVLRCCEHRGEALVGSRDVTTMFLALAEKQHKCCDESIVVVCRSSNLCV